MDLDPKALQPFEREVLDCLNRAPARVKYCARSATIHLAKARKLVGVDDEMVVFRAFCAEEEAATSLFAALKFRGYERSAKLNYRSHTQKQAAYPFLRAIGNLFAAAQPPLPRVRLAARKEGDGRRLLVQLQAPGDEWAEPNPPLNFSVVAADTGRRALFSKEFKNLASGAGHEDVVEFIKVNANRRNQILYAADDGVPVVSGGVEDALLKAHDRVFALLTVSCLVFPYAERAHFAQQSLDAFLVAVGSVDESDLNW